mgnify:CR=1 FL=1|tara:strand:- start:4900 stop:5958 length:1059 start_codon:yes stop_codon:yes gene_type:complete
MIVLEGFIDLHTHTRYPDFDSFDYREIEESAIIGGYTNILAMPNSEQPIDCINNLNLAKNIDSLMKINVCRTGSLTKNLQGKELVNFEEFIQNGVYIFTDDGKSLVDDNLAEKAFKEVSRLGGAIFQHCEINCHSNPGDIASNKLNNELIEIDDYEETSILKRDLKLVEKYGTRYHAMHISSKSSVEILNEALNQKLPVTSEVTPHHLLKNNENMDISDGKYKMYPPLRTEDDRQALIEGLKKNIIQVIATDHAPHPLQTKKTSFKLASRGVVGLESTFPMLFTSGIFTIEELSLYLIENPKKILKNLGYSLDETTKNGWQDCNKKFTTKSKYDNSIFENEKIIIERCEVGI